jgi:NPCBM/NEW2 domain
VPLAEKQRLWLEGDRLHIHPLGVQTPAGLAPPLPSVAILWLGGLDDAKEPALQLRRLVASRPRQDVLLFRDGNREEGTVLALDSARECRFKTRAAEITVPWAQIGAIAFSSPLQLTKLPAHPHFHLVLANGARLGLASARLKAASSKLEGTTLSGDALEVAVADLAALDVRGGSATYLSDLPPLKYEHTPFLGTSWPLGRDVAADGGPLRLGGSVFDKGLGTHSACRVIYTLEKRFRWFEARVGLDPECAQRGRARIRVAVDGQSRELGWNKELTGADGPLALRVDVARSQELTLEVLFGSTGDVQARVNWVDARLLE